MLDQIRSVVSRTLQVSRKPKVTMPSDDPIDRIERLRGMAVAVGLRKLMCGPTFYINDLRNLLDAAQIVPDAEAMRILQVLHCVKWEEMPVELRNEAARTIASLFDLTPAETSQ